MNIFRGIRRMGVGVKRQVVSAAPKVETLWKQQLTDADYWSMSANAAYTCQQIKNDYASVVKVSKFEMLLTYVNVSNAYCKVMTGRYGTGATDYGSQSDTLTITSGKNWYTFTWSTYPEVPALTDFVVSIFTTGTPNVRCTLNDSNAYENSSYDLWTANIHQTADAVFKLYIMQ